MQMHSGMEFLWQASPSFGEETKIFTHNLDNSYCSASQFYFEDSDPVNSNNVAQYARAFVEMARIRSNFFKNKPNRVLIPVGCDFTFNGKNARNQVREFTFFFYYFTKINQY